MNCKKQRTAGKCLYETFASYFCDELTPEFCLNIPSCLCMFYKSLRLPEEQSNLAQRQTVNNPQHQHKLSTIDISTNCLQPTTSAQTVYNPQHLHKLSTTYNTCTNCLQPTTPAQTVYNPQHLHKPRSSTAPASPHLKL